jgi:hypothetical protein
MTDRELLELAAKAAGIHVRTWDGHSGPMCAIDDDLHGSMWMPLSDDGDALRLAVKLSLAVVININGGAIVMSHDASVSFEDACTRRAIVRTAAEIGKEKTE